MVCAHFCFYLGAGRGGPQALQEFRYTTVGDPWREAGSQSRASGNVGVHVRSYILSGVTRRLDHPNDFGHGTPAGLPADFKMEDFNRQMRFTPNAQRLGDGRWLALSFTAHVRAVDTAVLRSHFCQVDQFFGFGVVSRWINEGR